MHSYVKHYRRTLQFGARTKCLTFLTTTVQSYGGDNVMVTLVQPSLELHSVSAMLCGKSYLYSCGHMVGSSSLQPERVWSHLELYSCWHVKVSMHLIKEAGYLEELAVSGIEGPTQFSNVFERNQIGPLNESIQSSKHMQVFCFQSQIKRFFYIFWSVIIF